VFLAQLVGEGDVSRIRGFDLSASVRRDEVAERDDEAGCGRRRDRVRWTAGEGVLV
jgi:hypothetical protein